MTHVLQQGMPRKPTFTGSAGMNEASDVNPLQSPLLHCIWKLRTSWNFLRSNNSLLASKDSISSLLHGNIHGQGKQDSHFHFCLSSKGCHLSKKRNCFPRSIFSVKRRRHFGRATLVRKQLGSDRILFPIVKPAVKHGDVPIHLIGNKGKK